MSATTVESHATGIWQRVLHPEVGDFPPEAARRFLKWDFADTDKKRADELAAKALEVMETWQITSLVILDGSNRPAGVIHMHDILRAKIV